MVVVVQGTFLISLLQPAPEVYNLFDDVMLMSHGRIVYLGPREDVLPFLAAQHLTCPPVMTAADFLQVRAQDVRRTGSGCCMHTCTLLP